MLDSSLESGHGEVPVLIIRKLVAFHSHEAYDRGTVCKTVTLTDCPSLRPRIIKAVALNGLQGLIYRIRHGPSDANTISSGYSSQEGKCQYIRTIEENSLFISTFICSKWESLEYDCRWTHFRKGTHLITNNDFPDQFSPEVAIVRKVKQI